MKLLFTLLCSLSFFPSFTQNIIFVNVNNETPIQDGQSWETAYDNLAFAFFMAQPGDSLWIAAGTYHPTFGTNRTLSFLLRTDVQAYGGFGGSETTLEDRDIENNITLLSGDIGVGNDSTDNSYHVIQAPEPTNTTILDGLYIAYGNADGDEVETRHGGGVFISNSNDAEVPAQITIRNCTFYRNSGRLGGAIAIRDESNHGVTPTIQNCLFNNNRAYSSGGAIYRNGDNSGNDTIIFRMCVFEENEAHTGGGAIDIGGLSQRLEIHNCEFLHNYCVSSGGGVNLYNMTGNAEVLINDCILDKNIGNDGGGMFCFYSSFSATDTSQIIIQNSRFSENESTFSGGGGLLIAYAGNACQKVTIEQSGFINNLALERGAGVLYQDFGSNITLIQNITDSRFIGNQGGAPLGGAYYIRGALGGNIQNYNNFVNCIFAHNTGSIDISSGKPGFSESLFLNCTFYENGAFNISKNWAPDFDYETYYNQISVKNCIFQQSDAVNMRSHLLNGFLEGYDDNLYDFAISHSIVAAPDCNMLGGETACGDDIQYNTLPSFLNPVQGDFRVSTCSPAIDAGEDTLIAALNIIEDIDGNSRIRDSYVDLGAYEQERINLQIDSLLRPSCPGRADGALRISATGIAPYDYHLFQDSLPSSLPLDSLPAGQYTLVLTDSTACTDTIFFNISEADSIKAIAEILPASVDQGGSISIVEILGGVPPFQYHWEGGDTTSTINDLPPGMYTVTITDNEDCSMIYTYEVDFVNQVEEPTEMYFKIYPNPSRGDVILDYKLGTNAHLYIHNMLGQRIFKQYLTEGKQAIKISLDNIKKGIYSISALADGVRLYHQSLIIID